MRNTPFATILLFAGLSLVASSCLKNTRNYPTRATTSPHSDATSGTSKKTAAAAVRAKPDEGPRDDAPATRPAPGKAAPGKATHGKSATSKPAANPCPISPPPVENPTVANHTAASLRDARKAARKAARDAYDRLNDLAPDDPAWAESLEAARAANREAESLVAAEATFDRIRLDAGETCAATVVAHLLAAATQVAAEDARVAADAARLAARKRDKLAAASSSNSSPTASSHSDGSSGASASSPSADTATATAASPISTAAPAGDQQQHSPEDVANRDAYVAAEAQHIRTLAAKGKLDEAIAQARTLAGEAPTDASRALVVEVADKLVTERRDRAAKLFVEGSKAKSKADRDRMQREAEALLARTLDEIPESSLTQKLRDNLDAVRRQLKSR